MTAHHSIAQLTHKVAKAATPSSTSPALQSIWIPKTTVSLQTRSFATPAPPVTQNAVGSKGPTAMVFLNMGGPSTTSEVGDFLSRLFVNIVPSVLDQCITALTGL